MYKFTISRFIAIWQVFREMPEVFPLQDPPPWSLQSAYLGQSLLEQHGLRPGEAVVLRLGGGAGLVCRAWLHPVPGVTFVEAASAVVAGSLDPHLALGQLEEIVKLSEVTAKQVEVTVVSLPKFLRKNVSNLVKKMLHNLVLTNDCQVTFSENDGRYGVHSVTVNCDDGAGDAFIVGTETTVKIRNIVSKRRLDLIESVKSEARQLGGVEDAFKELKSSLLECRSVLVSGPTGCGKSALVTAVLAHLELPGLVTDCSGLASPEPGHTEAAVRGVWAEVEGLGGGALVLDSAECVAGGRGRGRVTQQLATLLDTCRGRGVVVVAVTTCPDSLDPALRRPGRLETEVRLRSPDQEQRRAMLAALCAAQPSLQLEPETLLEVARRTAGYLVADLALLVSRLSRLDSVDTERLEQELLQTRPAQLRSGLGTVSTEAVSWDSLGGLREVKAKLVRAVQLPLTHPASFARLGVRPSKGVLLSGPPGCGKTRLVRAVASSCHVTFLSVSAAEIFSPYVGDSERAIVEVFTKARQSSPALLFIDEIETLVAGRDYGGAQSSSDRVLAALLTEMDGLGGELGGGVVVVGATNRPQVLDSALTRPGRLDTHISVPAPHTGDRREILDTLLRKVPHSALDTGALAAATEGYTGADLECVVREAVLLQLSRNMEACQLEQDYLEEIISKYNPSLSRKASNLQISS